MVSLTDGARAPDKVCIKIIEGSYVYLFSAILTLYIAPALVSFTTKRKISVQMKSANAY